MELTRRIASLRKSSRIGSFKSRSMRAFSKINPSFIA